jgi:Uma2 family endonuclease
MTIKTNRIERYYDNHEWEGEEVGQGRLHFFAIKYLVAVLEWLFYGQAVGIVSDIYFFQTNQSEEAPLAPDLAVVDGLEIEGKTAEENPSYFVGEDGPPPRVVFEISSKGNWLDDLAPKGKRERYFELGIPEYFVFDPHQKTKWQDEWREYNRLAGWRRDATTGQYQALVKDEASRLWSEELQSWLRVEGGYLRLYTRDGQRRLTEAQAERKQREISQKEAKSEKARADAAQKEALAEKARAEVAQKEALAEKARAEAAEQRAARLAELLRQSGQNPDDLI